MQATMFANIEENQNAGDILASVNSAKDLSIDNVDSDEADDFMETYLAVNLELKVKEPSQYSKNQSR